MYFYKTINEGKYAVSFSLPTKLFPKIADHVVKIATKEFDKVTQSSLFHELLILNETEKYFTEISMATVGVKPILRYTFSVGGWKAMYDISLSMAMQTQEKVESLAKEIFDAIKASYETNKEVKGSGLGLAENNVWLKDEYTWAEVPTKSYYPKFDVNGLVQVAETYPTFIDMPKDDYTKSSWSWRDIISLPTNDVGETNKETN